MNRKELENDVWESLKKGTHCPNCGEKVTGRVMFKQWRKYYRFLCPNCETREQLRGKGYKGLQP